MAYINIVKNILEHKKDSYIIHEEKTVEDLIRSEIPSDVYNGTFVECYDCETGKTSFVPIEDDVSNINAIVEVNNKPVTLDYVIKENDLVNIIITPAGSWDWGGALTGALSGLSLGLSIGSAIGGPWGWLIGAVSGLVTGFFAGGLLGETIKGWLTPDEKNRTNKSGLDGKSKPDIRGAENQSLLNSPIPLVIGKHLATPAIVGSTWNEISGVRGENSIVHALYIVGYGPLRITNIKLGERDLALNHATPTYPTLSNIFHGKLSGSDIIGTWHANDIEIEILQQGQNGEPVDYGTIYPYAKIQTDIKANDLYILDGALTENDVVPYKGVGLQNGLRNNPVYFSEQYPESLRVELNFPNGLYGSRSETVNNSSAIHYYQIPLFVAIQWRVYSKDNEPSNEQYSGEETVLPTYNYNTHEYETVDGKVLRGWHSFDTINGINKQLYTEADRINDFFAHAGNTLPVDIAGIYEQHIFVWGYQTDPGSEPTRDQLMAAVYAGAWVPISGYIFLFRQECDSEYTVIFERKGSCGVVPEGWYCYIKWTVPVTRYTGTANDGWIGGPVFNLLSLGANDFDTGGLNEIRCVTEVNLVQWARNNLRSASDTEEEFMNKFRSYFYNAANTAKSIEVRVIRISPCYLDQTVSNQTYGAMKYNDVFVWETLTSTKLDTKALDDNRIEVLRPLKENIMKKVCLISLKAKTDNTDQMSNSIKKLNCIAQSFAPYYDKTTKRWVPENVNTTTCYFNPNGNQITKSEYEQDRQNGVKSISRPAGNDFVKQIVNNYIRIPEHVDAAGRYFLPNDSTLNFCTNNVASMFLYMGIGPHIGVDALGYKQSNFVDDIGNFNLPSLAKWYTWAEDVTDGSTYKNEGFHYNHEGEYVHHNEGDLIHIYFAANAYLSKTGTVEQYLSKIAIAGRAVFTKDRNGRFTVVVDKEENFPVGVINQQNTIKTSCTISYQELPSGLQITYPDENDGYNSLPMYCMVDNEDSDNPKSSIEPYNIEFVTNNAQAWSLGQYFLANRVLNREVVTKQIGAEGYAIGLGNIVLVQDDLMLIGTDTGARITELIEDNEKIYGFIINNTFKYTGEEESYTSGGQTITRCVQGVIVMQPTQFNESRVITLRLAKKDYTKVIGNKEFKMKKGNTNLILLDKPITKGEYSKDGSAVYIYKPQVDNIVGFGLVTNIASLYRVVKVKQNAKHQFEFTLMKYQSDLYSYGKALPTFQNNMTLPDRSGENSFALSNTVDYKTLLEETNRLSESILLNVNSSIQNISDELLEIIGPPDMVTGVIAIAEESVISIKWNPPIDNGMKNTIKSYVVELSKDAGLTWSTYRCYKSSYEYAYNRNTDGYMEREDFEDWRVRVQCENIYGKSSVFTEPYQINVNTYGTFYPSTPTVTSCLVTRDEIQVKWRVTHTRTPYAANQYQVYLYKDGVTPLPFKVISNEYGVYTFVRTGENADGYPEEADFTNWRVKVVCFNDIHGLNEGVYSNEARIDTRNYGTWLLTLPVVHSRVTDRTIILDLSLAPRTDNKQVYGTVKFKVQIKKHLEDTIWYKPAQSLDPYPVFDPITKQCIADNENNYRDAVVYKGDWARNTEYDVNDVVSVEDPSSLEVTLYVCKTAHTSGNSFNNAEKQNWDVYDDFVSSYNTYVQTLPLKNQGINQLENTPYEYKVIAYNERGDSEPTTIVAIALCTNIRDIVKANETAKEAYISELSALSANIGSITEGTLGDASNFWDLSTFIDDRGRTHTKGAFRVGDADEYFYVEPIYTEAGIPTGKFNITFKVGNFEITSQASVVNGELVIQETEDSLDRTRITPTGTFYEHRGDSRISWSNATTVAKLDTRGLLSQYLFSRDSMVITNISIDKRRKLGHDIGKPYLSDDAIIYHFDTDKKDQNGDIGYTMEYDVEPELKDESDNEEGSPIDYKPAILALAPYSEIGKSLVGQYSLNHPLGNQLWTVDFWIEYIWAENQTIFDIGNTGDRISIVVSNGEPYYNTFEEGTVPYNSETVERTEIVYNSIIPKGNYVYHTDGFNEEHFLLEDRGVNFLPNTWMHFGVILDNQKIYLYVDNQKFDFARYSLTNTAARALFNIEKNSFCLDELYIDTVSEVFSSDNPDDDTFVKTTMDRIPWGAIDYKDKPFIFDVDDLNSFYTNIFDSPDFDQAIEKKLSYSTSEVDTGKKWIDGKTIYRKVLPNITFSTNVTQTVDVGANIDKGWIDLSKTVFHSTWFSSTRQLFSNSGMTDIFVNDNNNGADSNKVVFTTPFSDGSGVGGTTYIDIVVEYTKAT